MNRTLSLLAPWALLLAGAGAAVPLPAVALAALPDTGDEAASGAAAGATLGLAAALPGFSPMPAAHQVRIEQHLTIRITPGAPVMPPEVLDEIQQGPPPEHYAMRHMSQCVAIAGIGAVHGVQGNRLLFFMRDQHIVLAALEKACRAEDFYSGF